MKSWEFLIQKKGSPAWLALKTQKLKLEAGEYRLVARSHQPNLDVEIRVTHQTLEEVQSKRRSQKRPSRTNAEGLLAILPFINLQPGLWQICCSAQQRSERLQESWQEVVQLHVLPQATSSEVREPSEAAIPSESDSSENIAPPEASTMAEFEESVAPEGATEAEPMPEAALETRESSPEGESNAESFLSAFLTDRSRGRKSIPATPSPSETTDESPLQVPMAATTQPFDGTDESLPTPSAVEDNPSQPSIQQPSDITEESPTQEPIAATTQPSDGTEESPPIPSVATDAEDELLEDREMQNAIADTESTVEAIPTQALETSEELDPQEAAEIESLLERSIQNLEQILAEASRPKAEPAPPDPPAPAVAPQPDLPETLANLQLRLTLYHENFVRHQGESLLISGQVDAIDPSQNDLGAILTSLEGQQIKLILRYLLRDPQTSAPSTDGSEPDSPRVQLLFNSQQPSASATLPKIFGYRLEVPEKYHNPLILGEVLLEITLGDSQTAKILARSPFTIAAAVDELLEAAFSQQEAERHPSLPELADAEPAHPPIKTEFIELAKQPPQPHSYSPGAQQVLPPKLSASASGGAARALKLPEFPTFQPLQPSEDETAEEPAAGETLEKPPAKDEEAQRELEAVAPEAETSPHAEAEQQPPQFHSIDETLPPIPPEDLGSLREEARPEQTTSASQTEQSELDNAFQSLHLEERFWSRMNSLVEEADSFAAESPLPEEGAADEELQPEPVEVVTPTSEAAEFNFEEEAAPSLGTVPTPPEGSAVEVPLENLFAENVPSEESQLVELSPIAVTPAPPAPLEEFDWAQNEIVVDDDEEMPPPASPKRDTSGLPYPLEAAQAPSGTQPKTPARAASDTDEPIPMPVLQVSEGELVAGEPALVRVKLPPFSDSVYVKLWVLDCQTRSLLDGPRAFVDFTANQDGDLETITQLLVPLGSLEIRFEAIAIDIETQRESHKASVSRSVVPPDLPNTLFNEF